MITYFRINVEGQHCYGAVGLTPICCGGLSDGRLLSLWLVQTCAGAESQNISAVEARRQQKLL